MSPSLPCHLLVVWTRRAWRQAGIPLAYFQDYTEVQNQKNGGRFQLKHGCALQCVPTQGAVSWMRNGWALLCVRISIWNIKRRTRGFYCPTKVIAILRWTLWLLSSISELFSFLFFLPQILYCWWRVFSHTNVILETRLSCPEMLISRNVSKNARKAEMQLAGGGLGGGWGWGIESWWIVTSTECHTQSLHYKMALLLILISCKRTALHMCTYVFLSFGFNPVPHHGASDWIWMHSINLTWWVPERKSICTLSCLVCQKWNLQMQCLFDIRG